MDEINGLEKLKSIKRRAKLMHECYSTIYTNKVSVASPDLKKIFIEAINALDSMQQMYEELKTGMRARSIPEQIAFAIKWETYIACIQSLTAFRTKDEYLLSGGLINETEARETAIRLWMDYNQQLQQQRFIQI